jgi:hypothetical protein
MAGLLPVPPEIPIHRVPLFHGLLYIGLSNPSTVDFMAMITNNSNTKVDKYHHINLD